MKCLVTGASGFVGSYLVEFLAKEGHEVTALAVCEARLLRNAASTFAFVEADLLDRKSIGMSDRLSVSRGCLPPGRSELSECLLETARSDLRSERARHDLPL